MVSDNCPPLPSPAPVVFVPFCLPVFPAISASSPAPHPCIPLHENPQADLSVDWGWMYLGKDGTL